MVAGHGGRERACRGQTPPELPCCRAGLAGEQSSCGGADHLSPGVPSIRGPKSAGAFQQPHYVPHGVSNSLAKPRTLPPPRGRYVGADSPGAEVSCTSQGDERHAWPLPLMPIAPLSSWDSPNCLQMLATVPWKRPTEEPHRALLQPTTSPCPAGASTEAAAHIAAETQGRPLASVNSHPNGMFAIICVSMKEDTSNARSSGPITSGPGPGVNPVSVSQLSLPGPCPALCPPPISHSAACVVTPTGTAALPPGPLYGGHQWSRRALTLLPVLRGSVHSRGAWSPVLTRLRILHEYRLPPGILHVICHQVTHRPQIP